MFEMQMCGGFLMDPELWARLTPEAPGLAGYPLANGLTIVFGDLNLSMNATVEASVWENGQPVFGPEEDMMTWTIDESPAFRKVLCRLLDTLDFPESSFSELGLFPFQEMSQDDGPKAKLPLIEFDALPLKQAWVDFTQRHLPG